MLHETCLCAICVNLVLSKSHTHTDIYIMCCTHLCNDLTRLYHSRNHQKSKERIHEGEERRTCKYNGYRLH